jgi:hypothetical protein
VVTDGAAAVVEPHFERETVNATRASFDPRGLIADTHQVFDIQPWANGQLFDDAGAVQRFDEGEARAVAAGHFRAIDPDFAVVDAQAGEGGHDVFDHVDRSAAARKRGAPRDFHAIRHNGRDSRTARQVAPHEDDAGVGGRWAKLDARIASAPIAHAFDRRRGGYRSLVSCCFHPEASVIHDKG